MTLRIGRRRQGQSLVELGVALPFVLLLMLGTLDLGRMFFDYIELRNGVREAAAYGSRNPTDTAGIKSRVTSHGDFAAGATVSEPAFTGSCTTVGATGAVTVAATRTFVPITTSFLDDWGLGSVNLAADATMRCLT